MLYPLVALIEALLYNIVKEELVQFSKKNSFQIMDNIYATY